MPRVGELSNLFGQLNGRSNLTQLIWIPKTLYVYVTEFWKITLMGMHETIRIADFTMVLWTAESTFQIFLKFFW